MSITRKTKRGLKKMPLSRIDKAIYTILIILGFVYIFVMLATFGHYIPESIIADDESIIARDYSFTMLFALPTMIFVSLTTVMLGASGIHYKQPIFGNKKFKASALRPVIRTTPIFSADFKKKLPAETKKKIKKITAILLAIFLVCIMLLPFGIYPRKILDDKNTFTTYNSFNHTTHTASIYDAEKLVIMITRSRRGSGYGISLIFDFDNVQYDLSLGSFDKMTREETLNYMLYLKSFFSDGRYEIKNIRRMDMLTAYKDFSNTEIDLVYELFDYNQ